MDANLRHQAISGDFSISGRCLPGQPFRDAVADSDLPITDGGVYLNAQMADRAPEISGGLVVLRGSFNPQIFQPQWFQAQNLLPPTEAERAEVKIIHPQICNFETERYIIVVTADRFECWSKPNTNLELLRDLVGGTFFVLEHTPVSAMGLNHFMHFRMESENEWHRIGDRLAPKEGWNAVLPGRPGMLNLTITTLKEDSTGSYVVKVEPSVHVTPGVYFETNDHYQASGDDALKSLMKILRDEWDGRHVYASKIAHHIFDWAL